jgi:CheY-like chemotaxis protein
MPGMGGVEVLRRIRAEWSGLPVVLVTGFPESAEIEEARELGIAAVVAKPLIIKNLATVLDDLSEL